MFFNGKGFLANTTPVQNNYTNPNTVPYCIKSNKEILLVARLFLVDGGMPVPFGCLTIKRIETKTMKFSINVGIPSM